jgi:cyclopropane fatty-acyl-phospholipid synthase-like methyltransferase
MTTRNFPNWHELYEQQPVEGMPWYYPGLDPDLERALARHGLTSGRVLDLGTGPGTQAIALAERGFDVTGSDLSAGAVAQAQRRSAGLHARPSFVVDDVLDSQLTGPFDIVFDRGCFHVFAPQDRPRYARQVASWLRPGAWLFLKCFSHEQPGDFGPYRLTPEELESTFKSAFATIAIETTVYQGTMNPLPIALFCTLRRGSSD